MSELEFRPRFRFATPLSTGTVRERIGDKVLRANPKGLVLDGSGGHMTLRYPMTARRSWTPEMSVDVEDQDGVTIVRCLIGPAPNIWMMFVGGYIFWSFFAIVGITLGVSQQVVKETPWGYWLLVPALIGSVIMFGMVQEGKRRSHHEMRELKTFVDEALGCDCFKLAMESEAS